MLCYLRGSETSSVMEEKHMHYAVDEKRIGASSDNENMMPLRCTKHETGFVFAEPFVKTYNANSL